MRADEANIESRPGRRAPIHPAMTVRQIAADYPACRAVFRRHGEPERSSAKFGHLEPLDHFAQRHGIPLDMLLAELSQAAGAEISREDPSAGRAHRPFVAAALAVTLSLGAALVSTQRPRSCKSQGCNGFHYRPWSGGYRNGT